MTAHKRSIVYSGFRATRSGYFVAGLRQLGPIRYRRQPFAPTYGLAFERDGVRYFVDSRDQSEFVPRALEWCDVYGKVNLDPHAPCSPKVVAIGPHFAIKTWSLLATLYVTLRSLPPTIRKQRDHIHSMLMACMRRAPLVDYVPGDSEQGYIFHLSTQWRNEPELNALRTSFCRIAAAAPGVSFEGGLARRPDFQGVPDDLLMGRLPFQRYLECTKRSMVVFNTPAVAGCHGWKLGEFLALGKAIISTPLSRAVPEPLEHKVHLHIVDGSPESIATAIRELSYSDYRRTLECNARRYWEHYLRPDRMITRLLIAGGERGRNAANSAP